jgi:2-dehydropantoate 2-reductase
MEFGIIGAGAMGGLFGGYLAAADEAVHLLDISDEQIRAINNDGLNIERQSAEDLAVHPHATTDPNEIDPVDVAFVFVKANHTEEALLNANRMFDEDTVLITLQNGFGVIEEIRSLRPNNLVLGGPAYVAANVSGPGRIEQTGDSISIKLGGDSRKAADGIARILSKTDIPTETVDNPEPYIWDKQLYGVGTKPVAALTHLYSKDIQECDEVLWAVKALIKEGVDVARAKGIDLPTDDHAMEVERLMREFDHPNAKASMLEDVEKKRKTEIEYLNGFIADEGERHGVATPYNRLVTSLIKGREREYL